MEARQKVEHVSLAKLKEWRDETGEQSNEIEDTFREVIVLDDEDESSDGEIPDEREQSMEIVSNRVYARDIQFERYPQYPAGSEYERRRGHGRTIVVRPNPPPPTTHRPQAPQHHAQGMRPSRAHNETVYAAHSRPPNDQLVSTPITDRLCSRRQAIKTDSGSAPIDRSTHLYARCRRATL